MPSSVPSIPGFITLADLWPVLERMREALLVVDVWSSAGWDIANRLDCQNSKVVSSTDCSEIVRVWPNADIHVYSARIGDRFLHILFGNLPTAKEVHGALAYLSILRAAGADIDAIGID
jgi:hypothetical protein